MATRQEQIKAFTAEQLGTFLATAARTTPRASPLFFLLARTGMRLGEAVALQWDDLDFTAREIRVARALSAGRVETPKAGHGRTLDMSQQLARVLRRLEIDRKAETLRRGWREVPPWIFCSDAGTPLDHRPRALTATVTAKSWSTCRTRTPGRRAKPTRPSGR